VPNVAFIRPGRDGDADGFIALIGTCWAQYPGVRLDVDGEVPELRALGTYYAGQGGALWAAEAAGAIVGMIATRPLDAGPWEFCKLYTLPSHHGGGLGHRLLDSAEAHAIAAGATCLQLWSDTRFERAHRFYEKRCYVRSGPLRVLDDISHSLEFGYAKPADGVELLDAAAAASAEPALAALCAACGVARCAPFEPTGGRFRHGAPPAIAAGRGRLLVGWSGGILTAAASLALPGTPSLSHRARLAALWVHPAHCGQGLGRALLARVEAAAQTAGRILLTAEAPACGAGRRLFGGAGWQESGPLLGFTRRPDGTLDDLRLFWKRLG
jgi:GNAT superfamily N-acetyltransferase